MKSKTSDSNELFEYVLRLGDNTLVLGHRLSEWCGHGPAMEEDIALTNIALDLIGQAKSLLNYAGQVEGRDRSEDDLAYLRDGRDYRNVLLVEQPNNDFAFTIARQFLYEVWSMEFLKRLSESNDDFLSGYAGKAIKECTYHLRHSAEWLIRLGDGTELSHDKAQAAVNDLWPYTGELLSADEIDDAMVTAGIGVDPGGLKGDWERVVSDVLKEATLERPEDGYMHSGGKNGRHSEYLGHMLAEMQYLQRAYPGCEW